jgi:hypothetical protein
LKKNGKPIQIKDNDNYLVIVFNVITAASEFLANDEVIVCSKKHPGQIPPGSIVWPDCEVSEELFELLFKPN